MTKPNVDWKEINWSQMVIHPTTAQQDNMRAVRMQLGGEAIDCDRAVVEAETSPVMGVGESIFSPEEIAYFRDFARAAYEETLKAIQAFHAMADAKEMTHKEIIEQTVKDMMLIPERRFLVEDTEFSDSDVEDYYLGKAPT